MASHISRTVDLTSFTLGLCFSKGPRKCSVRLGAICTHDTFNINKLWIYKRLPPCSCGNWEWLATVAWTLRHGSMMTNYCVWQMILQVTVLCTESSFTKLWINRCQQLFVQLQGLYLPRHNNCRSERNPPTSITRPSEHCTRDVKEPYQSQMGGDVVSSHPSSVVLSVLVSPLPQPPPPGHPPNAAQLAAMQGANVVMSQRKSNFFLGGSTVQVIPSGNSNFSTPPSCLNRVPRPKLMPQFYPHPIRLPLQAAWPCHNTDIT